MALMNLTRRGKRPRSGPAMRGIAAPAGPRVSALAEQARALGFALVPLELVAGLEEREAIVAAGEARGHELLPLMRQLGDLAGDALPGARDRMAELMIENASLHRRIGLLERDFSAVAMWLLLGESIPETLDATGE